MDLLFETSLYFIFYLNKYQTNILKFYYLVSMFTIFIWLFNRMRDNGGKYLLFKKKKKQLFISWKVDFLTWNVDFLNGRLISQQGMSIFSIKWRFFPVKGPTSKVEFFSQKIYFSTSKIDFFRHLFPHLMSILPQSE